MSTRLPRRFAMTANLDSNGYKYNKNWCLHMRSIKEKLAFLLIAACLLLPIKGWADTIYLKSGETISGQITYESPIFVRIQTLGEIETQEYLAQLIDHIERNGEAQPLDRSDAKEGLDSKAQEPPAAVATIDEKAEITVEPKTFGKIILPAIRSPGYKIEGMNVKTTAPTILNNDSIQELLASDASKVVEKPAAPKKIEKKGRAPRTSRRQEAKTPAEAAMKKMTAFKDKYAVGTGVGLIVLIGIMFVLTKIRESAQVKEQRDEIKSIGDLKVSGSVSEEEYASLLKNATDALAEAEGEPFWKKIPGVFIYPLQGHVLLATVGASVFFYFYRIALVIPFYGFIAAIMLGCYIVACVVKIIETAVTSDRADLFDWPDFTEWVDWFGKFFLFIIGWIICHGTAIFIFWKCFKYAEIQFIMIPLCIGLFILGVFVYPMYILSMSLVGGLASLNIVNVLKAIGTTFVAYMLTFLVLTFTQFLSVLANLIPLNAIPFLGGILHQFIFVYFLLVDMRLLGIFYKSYRLKLRWYGEDE